MKMVRLNFHIPEQSLYKIVAYLYNVNQEQDHYFHGRSSTIHKPEKYLKKVSEPNQEIHNHNCRQTHGIVRKSHTTIMRHQGDKQSKATSLFPIKMIAKLEWTQSNAQQNIEQLQNLTMVETINSESTTTEPCH